MNRGINRWVDTVARVPGVVIIKSYDLLFGWWLNKSLARKHEKELEQDIHDALPFLFDEYHGHRVPNEGVPFPPDSDYAFVTVAVDNLLIRFCRGQGGLEVLIASADTPTEWHELCLLLNVIEKQNKLKRWGILDVWDASR